MAARENNAVYPESQSVVPEGLHDAMPVRGGLPDDGPSPLQIALFRAMTGQRRLKLAEALYWEARKLKAVGVRYQHPDWPEEKVATEVNRIFLHARS